MCRRLAAVVATVGVALFLTELAAQAPAAPIDWSRLGEESARVLSDYLRVDTTNPPGNELKAAEFLKALLDREQIESQIFEYAPGRADLYARMRGDGSRRSIVLLNHTDVVPANREFWQVNPFGGVTKDGFVWGRGALDMKGTGVTQLMAMIALKRSHTPLKRDIIFLATADEEAGSTGARWFAEHQRDLLGNAEFLLNEGGRIRMAGGRVDYYGVGLTEKSPFWLELTATGEPGHGSQPRRDTAVNRLVRALGRIASHETPIKVTPAVEKFFADLAARQANPARREMFAHIQAAVRNPAAAAELTRDQYFNAILRNTISATVLQAGNKTNVIPPEARAQLDVRLLPGENPQAFLAELTRVAAEPDVKIAPLAEARPATSSPIDTDLFRAIVSLARQHDPGALVTTPMLSGYTDSHFFRELGIVSYGLDPVKTTDAEDRGVHGNDERVSLENLTFGTRFTTELLIRLNQ